MATEILFKMSLRLGCNLTSDDLEYEIEEGADDHDPRSCEGGHELPGASFVVEDAPLSSASMKVKVLKDLGNRNSKAEWSIKFFTHSL